MSYCAYLAFENHGILPRDFLAMPAPDRAFLLACDLKKAEEQSSMQKKLTRQRVIRH